MITNSQCGVIRKVMVVVVVVVGGGGTKYQKIFTHEKIECKHSNTLSSPENEFLYCHNYF